MQQATVAATKVAPMAITNTIDEDTQTQEKGTTKDYSYNPTHNMFNNLNTQNTKRQNGHINLLENINSNDSRSAESVRIKKSQDSSRIANILLHQFQKPKEWKNLNLSCNNESDHARRSMAYAALNIQINQ